VVGIDLSFRSSVVVGGTGAEVSLRCSCGIVDSVADSVLALCSGCGGGVSVSMAVPLPRRTFIDPPVTRLQINLALASFLNGCSFSQFRTYGKEHVSNVGPVPVLDSYGISLRYS
jgi:hypothetical protein